MLTVLSIPEGFPWMICSPTKAHLLTNSVSFSPNINQPCSLTSKWTASDKESNAAESDTQKAADDPKPEPSGSSEVITALPGLYLTHRNRDKGVFGLICNCFIRKLLNSCFPHSLVFECVWWRVGKWLSYSTKYMKSWKKRWRTLRDGLLPFRFSHELPFPGCALFYLLALILWGKYSKFQVFSMFRSVSLCFFKYLENERKLLLYSLYEKSEK